MKGIWKEAKINCTNELFNHNLKKKKDYLQGGRTVIANNNKVID